MGLIDLADILVAKLLSVVAIILLYFHTLKLFVLLL